MKKRNIRSFKIHWYILVLLLVSLTVSIALNVYLYSKEIKPPREYGTNILIVRDIQGGMGKVSIVIGQRLGFSFEHEIGYVSVPHTFNISVMVSLWAPYTGADTYYFVLKLYERTLRSEYTNTPIAEETVSVQKDKDAMYVEAYAILTVTAPSDSRIYIYKVVIEGALDYEVEFPIFVE